MNVPTTLGVFAAGLAAVFAVGVGTGRVVGPIGDEPAPMPHGETHSTGMTTSDDHADGGH